MQVSATDIFRVGSTAGATARKASPLGSAGAAPASRMEQDIVSISDLARQMQAKGAQAGEAGFVAKGRGAAASRPAASLGEALTGEVAKIFSHLSEDAKAKLEDGVAGGKVSVKEVEEGLKYLANREVATGVQRARVRDPEEIAAAKDFADIRSLLDDVHRTRLEFSAQHRELGAKWVGGEISVEEFEKQSAALGEQERLATSTGPYENIEDRYSAARDKSVKMAFDGWQKALGGPLNEAKWQASMEKLDAIGFDVHRNRQSFKNYAASQETPTMYRADAA